MKSNLLRFFVFACGFIFFGVSSAPAADYTIVQFDFYIYPTSDTLGILDKAQIRLYDAEAPITVANFLSYVNSDAYDGTFFHRLFTQGIEVLQGGGFYATFNSSGTFSPTAVPQIGSAIVNEYSDARPNAYGTIAMAKISGNPNSATNQWFFNLIDNTTSLGSSNNGGFAVFGYVINGGMNYIDIIGDLTAYNLSSYNSALTTVPLAYTGTGYNLITMSQVASFHSGKETARRTLGVSLPIGVPAPPRLAPEKTSISELKTPQNPSSISVLPGKPSAISPSPVRQSPLKPAPNKH